MIEGELQLIGEALLDYTMNGRVQRRAGNAHPSMAPHGAYPCAGDDRWIAIACGDDAQWRALCGVIGRPELASDARFADVVSRLRHSDEVNAIVAAWTRARDAREAMSALQLAGVPAGAVQSVPDLLADPQLRHRGWLQPARHPEAGEILHTRVAFTLSRTPSPIERAAPVFAQDNRYVFQELLGMREDEVRALEAAGVIRGEPPEAKR
jgi:benzylsuccinate CoA-transferase BbsF subunit